MADVESVSGGLGKAIARGAVWTLSIRFFIRSISLISTLILARLLTPEDFGVYGLAMSVYAFVELLRAFGFGTALIQNQNATDLHYDTAWTMHFIFSFIASLALFCFAPFAADFLREEKLEIVVRFLCILFLVDAVKNIGIINFQKHMTFDREFRLQLSVKLSGFLITVPLAFYLGSYWAMLWGLLVSNVVLVLLSYLMQPYRPRFALDHWRELFSFTAWLQLNNILNYFNRHIENFMVSRVSGVAAVGSLRLAKETGQLLGEFTQPINRVAFPGYAKVNENPASVLEVFRKVMGVMMLVGFLISIGIVSIAHMMVPTLLGGQWLHIVPLVQGLALVILLRVWIASSNNVLIASGKQKWATTVVASRLTVFVFLLQVLLPVYGLMGVVYSSLLAMSLVLVLALFIMHAHIGLCLRHVTSLVYRPAIGAAAMWWTVQTVFPEHIAQAPFLLQLAQLIAAVLLGAVVYLVGVGLLWFAVARPDGAELNLLRLIQKRIGVVRILIPDRG